MTKKYAIKVTANSHVNPKIGHVQRKVLAALQDGQRLTTTQLAMLIYSKDTTQNLNSVCRAIDQLKKRGFNFTKIRQGRVNATGFVYLWSLTNDSD